jgi:hypothetical protein
MTNDDKKRHARNFICNDRPPSDHWAKRCCVKKPKVVLHGSATTSVAMHESNREFSTSADTVWISTLSSDFFQFKGIAHLMVHWKVEDLFSLLLMT